MSLIAFQNGITLENWTVLGYLATQNVSRGSRQGCEVRHFDNFLKFFFSTSSASILLKMTMNAYFLILSNFYLCLTPKKASKCPKMQFLKKKLKFLEKNHQISKFHIFLSNFCLIFTSDNSKLMDGLIDHRIWWFFSKKIKK